MDKHQDDATIVILGMEHQRELYHLGLVNASHPQISKSAVAVLGSFWDGFLYPEEAYTLFQVLPSLEFRSMVIQVTSFLKTKSCCSALTCAVSW